MTDMEVASSSTDVASSQEDSFTDGNNEALTSSDDAANAADSETFESGTDAELLSSSTLYDDMDEVLDYKEDLPIEIGSDLYDDTIMGTISMPDENSSNSQPDEVTDDQELDLSPESSIKVEVSTTQVHSRSFRKIPDAYTDDLMDEGVASQSPPNEYRVRSYRHFGVYVGNLTWWTTQEHVQESLKLVGVEDVLDVKIYECRLNGQSKGFCFVTLASEASVRTIFEKLEFIEIQGKLPIVRPDSKSSLVYFESQSKTRPPSTSSMQQGEFPMGQRNCPLPVQLQRSMTYVRHSQPYQRHYGHRSGPRHWTPGYSINGNSYSQRLPNGMSRFPPPPFGQPPPSFDEWTRHLPPYGVSRPGPHFNPAFLNRFPSVGEDYVPPPHQMDNTRVQYCGPMQYNNKPPEFAPISQPQAQNTMIPTSPERILATVPLQISPHVPFNSQNQNVASSPLSLSSVSTEEKSLTSGSNCNPAELGFDELLDRNNSICSLAIKRAVNDASNGEYASAIETLVTAISLIRSSKVAKEKRCQVLICSLQDTLEGIEHRSYGRQKRSTSVERVRRDKYATSSQTRPRSPCGSRGRDSFSKPQERVERDARSYRENQYFESKDRSSSGKRRSYEERDRGYCSSDLHSVRSKISRMDPKDSYRR